MAAMKKCRICGAPVFWIITDNGKPTLCGADEFWYRADPRGELLVTPLGLCVRGREVGTRAEASGIAFRPHRGCVKEEI